MAEKNKKQGVVKIMNPVYNFSAGPSTLPKSVLKKAEAELSNYKGSGMSVMELSHRGKLFMDIIQDAEKTLRELMNIPDDYSVMFLQGGASTQFAMVPMNLMVNNKKADYVVTGSWAQKAYEEAKKFGTPRVIANSHGADLSHIPKVTRDMIDPEADYVHITTNNTIEGTAFYDLPDTGDIPIVADMSSNILSEQIDVTNYGLIYAGAQKNIGPAGMTVVIIRKDLIGQADSSVPSMLDYAVHQKAKGIYNTPPTFSIYMAKLVFDWLKEDIGGLENMAKINEDKANLLYETIDHSILFEASIKDRDRSWMNVPFLSKTGDEELEKKFLKEAEARGLVTLKGHRSVGGMRASIYNAMPVEGVQALVDFIKEFDQKNS
ncbi:phosphoserine aminotransferase [Streptohalobacillus salinus]|uniref:Phosphoserine aminotransferase n=2 Tax=Streptohalobacillus salinus TaxID=621096 RepID=A0A2V3WTR7_9BACI|nr:phosphoserine aminotransferase [Streptohalobacillus salinus]